MMMISRGRTSWDMVWICVQLWVSMVAAFVFVVAPLVVHLADRMTMASAGILLLGVWPLTSCLVMLLLDSATRWLDARIDKRLNNGNV